MEGYIKISATDTGIATEVRLAHISGLDKILLLNAFAQTAHGRQRLAAGHHDSPPRTRAHG